MGFSATKTIVKSIYDDNAALYNMKKNVVIVDAFSSGAALAEEWKKNGFSCVHIQSSSNITKVLTAGYHPIDFRASFLHENFEATKKWCQNFSPQFVMAGAETGIELADRLAEEFCIPGNGTKHSNAKRNKYLMLCRLREYGLETGNFDIIHTTQEASTKWRSIGKTVVVKPLRSAGKDSVAVCSSDSAVGEAVSRIITSKTKLGSEQNNACLIQEFIEGQEFAMNTVSYDGRCYITDAWKYKRREANGVKVLFDSAEYVSKSIFENFAPKVTDALGIRFGPAHVELILSPKGLRVVDIGVRLCGASLPLVLRKCGAVDPVACAVDSYVNPKGEPNLPKDASSLEHIRVAFLLNLFEGQVTGLRADKEFRQLKSAIEVKWNLHIGDWAYLTRDSYTVAGQVWMRNDNVAKLEADYDFIKRFEANGLFDLKGHFRSV